MSTDITAMTLMTFNVIRREYRLIDCDSHAAVVLIETERDFVTWRYGSDGGFFWGHYFPKPLCDNAEALAKAERDAGHDFTLRRGAC